MSNEMQEMCKELVKKGIKAGGATAACGVGGIAAGGLIGVKVGALGGPLGALLGGVAGLGIGYLKHLSNKNGR